jgi:hypothetical protein
MPTRPTLVSGARCSNHSLAGLAAVFTNFVMAPFKPFKYEGMQFTELAILSL